MRPFGVAIRLWFRTVLLTGIFHGLVSVFYLRITDGLLTAAIVTVGFVVTFPLLLLITPVVGISKKLPYNVPAKVSFVTFGLTVIIVLFYGAFGWIIDGIFFNEALWLNVLMGVTISALLVTVSLTRRSFLKLYADI